MVYLVDHQHDFRSDRGKTVCLYGISDDIRDGLCILHVGKYGAQGMAVKRFYKGNPVEFSAKSVILLAFPSGTAGLPLYGILV